MIKCNCNIWEGCTCGAIEEERRLLKEGKKLGEISENVKSINTNKPLINCIIETNEEHNYFKFVKVDEVIRNKDNNLIENLGTFNEYEIKSMYSSYYYYSKTIFIFGCDKDDDNIKVKCNKEVILALEEAGCKIIIK